QFLTRGLAFACVPASFPPWTRACRWRARKPGMNSTKPPTRAFRDLVEPASENSLLASSLDRQDKAAARTLPLQRRPLPTHPLFAKTRVARLHPEHHQVRSVVALLARANRATRELRCWSSTPRFGDMLRERNLPEHDKSQSSPGAGTVWYLSQ